MMATSTGMTFRDRAEKVRREMHHEADIVVVGAGIFGCAIAWALGNQGRSVLLLEKSLKQPDRIVGELLQPGGVQALEKLGLRDCLDEIDAIKVFGYDVIYYGEEVRIPYPMDAQDGYKEQEKQKESRLDEKSGADEMRGTKRKRPEGRSFHHGRFIQKLREKAMSHPNVTVVEAEATELIRGGYSSQILGVEAKVNGEQDSFFAGLTIIADGYSSNSGVTGGRRGGRHL
jgi:squalene monooxygenase